VVAFQEVIFASMREDFEMIEIWHVHPVNVEL
jgi:hypothetical protein